MKRSRENEQQVSPKLKLWTLQNRKFVEDSSNEMLIAEWERAPQDWRGAYQWMASEWVKRIRLPLESALVWCWHSCNGKHYSPPTVGTASMLMGDWSYYAASTVLIQFNAPDNQCLLSSYTIWNEALDDFLEHKRDTIHDGRFDNMFEEPLMKHEDDDIQAVIPYIMKEWIVDIRELPETDDGWENAI